jgi:hypothetical protein
MQARYRTDYAGEFVITETRWSGGKKTQTREWIDNPIANHHISGRAACIGSDLDAWQFDHRRLARHRGGLLGSKKLQTYGTGDIAATMRLDFVVETRANQLTDLQSLGYTEKNIVYSTARQCLSYPGELYLIPLAPAPALLDLASIVRLAAFDGHQEIFLLGYNKETPVENDTWHNQISQIVQTYSGVRFYFVGHASAMYDAWLDCSNSNSMSYREFISYCDI